MNKLYEAHYFWEILKPKRNYFPNPFEIDIKLIHLCNILFNAKMRRVENMHNPIYNETVYRIFYD